MKQERKIFLFIFFASLLVMAFFPSPEIPLNDEWMFARSVNNFFETGIIACEGCTTSGTLLVGMGVFLTEIFSFSFTVFRILVIIFGALSVSISYLLIREVTKSDKYSILASVFLLANPIFFNTAHLFMTDIPFLFFSLLSIYFATRGIKLNDPRQFIFSAITISAAIFLRQIAIAIPFGILIYFLISNRKMLRSVPILISIFLPAIILGVFMLNQLQATGFFYSQEFDVKNPFGISAGSVYNTWSSLIYFGFFFMPIAYVSYKYLRRKFFIGSLVFFAITAIGANMFLSDAFPQTSQMPYLGNIMNVNGIGAINIPGQDAKSNFFSIPFWIFVTIVSIISASVIATKIIYKIREKNIRTPEFFLIIIMGTLLLTVLTKTGAFFDRYIIIFIPLLAFIFVDELKKSRTLFMLSIAAIIFLFSFSIVGQLDYIKWNEVRWQEISNLQAQGIREEMINGGFEFCLYNYGMNIQYEYWREIGVFDFDGVRPHDWKFCPGDDYIISFSESPQDFLSVTNRNYVIEKEVEYCSAGRLICDKLFVLKAI